MDYQSIINGITCDSIIHLMEELGSPLCKETNEYMCFKTIFRNQETGKPTRYIEGHDGQDGVFEIKDYVFNELMEIVQTRTYKNKTV